MNFSHSKKQRGATLIIGLIMLVVITLLVNTAFTLSSSNLKSVRNMQLRNEAIAAANMAIETVIGSPFTVSPVAETIEIDINNDGTNDYTVAIAQPTCTRAYLAASGTLSDPNFPTTSDTWNTIWDIDATATELTNATGTAVRVRSGTRVQLSNSQKTAVCP